MSGEEQGGIVNFLRGGMDLFRTAHFFIVEKSIFEVCFCPAGTVYG